MSATYNKHSDGSRATTEQHAHTKDCAPSSASVIDSTTSQPLVRKGLCRRPNDSLSASRSQEPSNSQESIAVDPLQESRSGEVIVTGVSLYMYLYLRRGQRRRLESRAEGVVHRFP